MGEFSNKVVVVTGGSRGIGRGIAESLRARGRADRDRGDVGAQSRHGRGRRSRRPAGRKPVTAALDLRKLEDCQKLHALVKKGLGRCDVLVNNAGATRAGNFLELSDDTWQDGFALKFFGCVRLSRLFWPMLKDAQGSRRQYRRRRGAHAGRRLHHRMRPAMRRWRISPRRCRGSA